MHYLIEFYHKILKNNDHENIKRNIKPIKKRISELQTDLDMSIKILSKNKDELLNDGQELVNEMKIGIV